MANAKPKYFLVEATALPEVFVKVTIELSNGGAIHISTKKYLTPQRVDLAEAGGIKPDIEAHNTEKDTTVQLNAAIKALS